MHQKVYAVSSWLWPECIQNLNGDSDQKCICFLMVEWKSPTNSRVFPASPQNQVEPKLLWILLLTAARAPYLVLAPQSIEPGQGQPTSPAVEASSSSHDSCGDGSPCDALISWKKYVAPGENADRAHIIPLSIAHRSAYSPRMSKVSSSELGAMREELPGTCFLRWCNWQSQQVAAASTEQQQNVFRLHIVVSSFTSDQVRLRKSEIRQGSLHHFLQGHLDFPVATLLFGCRPSGLHCSWCIISPPKLPSSLSCAWKREQIQLVWPRLLSLPCERRSYNP